ncbi:hypothetical protein PCL_10073 [Purpureocillium lilacinum]|uniref:Uncharacterized protein n=1 Tax=Purpureocillium lilacinum TaxID=33203 RepID=A0A2U3EEW8_PURLI|nr:hypothetical protein PCL_10073 [Purpureocillium lilacinum]
MLRLIGAEPGWRRERGREDRVKSASVSIGASPGGARDNRVTRHRNKRPKPGRRTQLASVGPVQLLGAGRGVADPGIASVGNRDKRAKAQPVSARGRTKGPRDARSQRSGPRSAKAHVVEQMPRGNWSRHKDLYAIGAEPALYDAPAGIRLDSCSSIGTSRPRFALSQQWELGMKSGKVWIPRSLIPLRLDFRRDPAVTRGC